MHDSTAGVYLGSIRIIDQFSFMWGIVGKIFGFN